MIQLILHLVGDYLTQSNWMAENKTRATWPAFCHALLYSLPFLFIGSPLAVFVIFATHLPIDRFRLARYVVWAKNLIFSPGFWRILTHSWGWLIVPPLPEDLEKERVRMSWENCSKTGAPADQSEFLAVWLMIVADNTIHLLVNWLALRYC